MSLYLFRPDKPLQEMLKSFYGKSELTCHISFSLNLPYMYVHGISETVKDN